MPNTLNGGQSKAFANAVLNANRALVNPTMDAVNPHFKNKYATLKSCLDTVRPTLARHGLVLMQFVMPSANGGDRLVTRLLHENGGFVEDEGISLVGADNMQKLGSAISYARRYGLLAILGLVGDPDDDAEVASAEPPRRSPEAKVQPTPLQVVADDIPLTQDDEQFDYVGWCENAIEGFDNLRNVAELKMWASVNQETLEKLKNESPELRENVLNKYQQRKGILNNA